MLESWAVYIDEEGFAQHWDETMAAFRGLNALMEAICRIGKNVYPGEVERLFAHQFGDGFLIGSDFHEENLSRATLIAIAILRHILAFDRIARAALVEGDIADVSGCYPMEVRGESDRSRVRLGAGILTTSSVLGVGLLRSVGLAKKGPRGPLLLVDSSLRNRLPIDVQVTDVEKDVISVDWLRGEPNGLHELQVQAELAVEPESKRVDRIRRYMDAHETLKQCWKDGVRTFLLGESIT